LDGRLFAAKSAMALAKELAELHLRAEIHYPAIDATGEGWGLYVFAKVTVLSPMVMKKRWTKREVIQRYNSRQNRGEDDSPYPEKSLSSKRLDRIIREIAELLLAAR
jgi:hypothetical protein